MSWADLQADDVLRTVYEDNLITQYIDISQRAFPDFDIEAFQTKSNIEKLDLAKRMEDETNRRNRRSESSKEMDITEHQPKGKKKNPGTASEPATAESSTTSNKRRKSDKHTEDPINLTLDIDNKIINQSDMETDAEPTEPIQPAKPKIPEPKPVVVYQVKDITKFASELDKVAKFALKTRKDNVRIIPETLQDKALIIEHLNSTDADYYNVSDHDYPLKAVIRGLPINMHTEVIKECLTSRNLEVTNVIQMTKRGTKEPMPLFLIHLARNQKSEEIFKINRLSHVIVKVENYRQPRKAIQCYACQSFSHTAKNCHRRIACIRCGLSHEIKDCDKHHKRINAPVNLHCINCGGPHPSSYKGCQNYENASAPRGKATTYAQAARIKSTQNINKQVTNSNQNCMALKRALPTQDTDSRNNLLTDTTEILSIAKLLDDIKSELRVNSFSEIKTLLETTLAKIKSADTPETKLFIFMDSLILTKKSHTTDASAYQQNTPSQVNSTPASSKTNPSAAFQMTPPTSSRNNSPATTTSRENLFQQPTTEARPALRMTDTPITEEYISSLTCYRDSFKKGVLAIATDNFTAPFNAEKARQELNRKEELLWRKANPAFGQLPYKTHQTTQSLPSLSRRPSTSSLASQN